jgi:hypothetical protein
MKIVCPVDLRKSDNDRQLPRKPAGKILRGGSEAKMK